MPQSARLSNPAAPNAATADPSKPSDALAANDAAPAEPLPVFVLTPETRARFAREAAKLPADAVKPMGSYGAEQIRWAGGVLATAWGDLPELEMIPIGDDAPLTREELVAYGERLEFAREAVHGGPSASPDDPTKLSDAALQKRLRGAHVAIADAVPLFLSGRTDEGAEQMRATCRAVRSGEAKKSLSDNGARLNLLLNGNSALAPWLSRLPKGEAAALDTLRRLHPEWVRREQIATGQAPPTADDDAADRAWALLAKTRERMLTAGRYLVSGRPERDGAYRGFTRPTPRKPRKAEGETKGTEAPAKGDARKAPDAPAAPAAKPTDAPANDAPKREPVTG